MNANEMNFTFAGEGPHTVRIGMAPEIFVYNGYEHKVLDRESFVSFMKKYGTPENTVATFDLENRTMRVTMDATTQGRPHDKLNLGIAISNEARRWIEILGKKLDQKNLSKFLERQKRPEFDGLIAAIKQLKFATTIAGDYKYDNNSNYEVIFKIGDAEGTLALPTELDVEIAPILENGICSGILHLELELIKPTSGSERPLICLTCPTLEDEIREATKQEFSAIRKELPGFLFLNGSTAR